MTLISGSVFKHDFFLLQHDLPFCFLFFMMLDVRQTAGADMDLQSYEFYTYFLKKYAKPVFIKSILCILFQH